MRRAPINDVPHHTHQPSQSRENSRKIACGICALQYSHTNAAFACIHEGINLTHQYTRKLYLLIITSSCALSALARRSREHTHTLHAAHAQCAHTNIIMRCGARSFLDQLLVWLWCGVCVCVVQLMCGLRGAVRGAYAVRFCVCVCVRMCACSVNILEQHVQRKSIHAEAQQTDERTNGHPHTHKTTLGSHSTLRIHVRGHFPRCRMENARAERIIIS